MRILLLLLSILIFGFNICYSSTFAIKDQLLNSEFIIEKNDNSKGSVISGHNLSTEEILLLIDIASYKTDNTVKGVDKIVRKQLNDINAGVEQSFATSEASLYSITQGTADFRSNLIGGITSGISDIYKLYMHESSINLVSATAKATLMATSSYVGYVVGGYAESVLISPITTTVLGSQIGSSVATVFGDIAGGALVGSLFALGAYAIGNTDRHLTRSMMIKSVAGSSVLAGTTFLLGSSTVTVGVFSLGTFILPYLTAVGTYYIVDNFFQLTDKVEEGERIDHILNIVR